MEKHIKALSYQLKLVGKRIKSSKKLNIWTFTVNERVHLIELYVSKFSGKKTLKVNGDIKSSGRHLIKEPIRVSEGVYCLVYSNGKNFQVSINGVAFDHLKKGNLNEIEIFVSRNDERWEDKAKAFGPVKKLYGEREKFPIKKINIEKLSSNISVDCLMVPSGKIRSSSYKEKGLNSEFTDLLS